MFFVWNDSKVFRDFLTHNTLNPRTKLKTFIQITQQKKWKSESSLACYCSSSTKKGSTSKTDISYRIYNPQIRKNVLNWRKNIIGFMDINSGTMQRKVKECKCKVCKVPFTRDHVKKCNTRSDCRSNTLEQIQA